MMGEETVTAGVINREVVINASPSQVWQALTDPLLVKQWMSENEIEIITDWQVGGPIVLRGGAGHAAFENKGLILEFVPCRLLQYSHLSSLSQLPDVPENYTVIAFQLHAIDGYTKVELTVTGFPTDSIYRHFAFYWNVAIVLLKKFVEERWLPAMGNLNDVTH